MDNIEQEEEQYSVTLAAKRIRLLASVVDYIIYFILFYILVRYFGTAQAKNGVLSFHLQGLPFFSSIIIWFLLIPAVEGINGQTIGKMIFGIRVIMQEGYKITTTTAIFRHIFDLIDFFPIFGIAGLIVSSRSELNQRVGDIVAKTIVIKKER